MPPSAYPPRSSPHSSPCPPQEHTRPDICLPRSISARPTHTITTFKLEALTDDARPARAPHVVHEWDRAAVAPPVGRGLPERRVVERAPAAALEVVLHVDALVRLEEPAPGRRAVQRAALHPARAHVPLHVPPARRGCVRRAAPRFRCGHQVKSKRAESQEGCQAYGRSRGLTRCRWGGRRWACCCTVCSRTRRLARRHP